jgi:death on curing protein
LKPSKTNRTEYLSVENLLLIHSAIIDETGGIHGVRDLGRLQGIIDHPVQIVFGKEIRETLFEKAAAYGFDVINYHPFVDGNKRSGMLSMAVFLELNGFSLSVKEGMIEKMALSVVVDKLKISDIAKWLKKHSKKIKQ